MKIEYVHASVYGNGAAIAEEFKRQMASRGSVVNVHHVDAIEPNMLGSADLYIFSSPGRFGKPIKGMRRFLKDIEIPTGSRYAVLTTEPCPQPDKRTGKHPKEEEIGVCQNVLPIMNEMLVEKGLVKVAEKKIYVTGLKGPLEVGWQEKVRDFSNDISGQPNGTNQS